MRISRLVMVCSLAALMTPVLHAADFVNTAWTNSGSVSSSGSGVLNTLVNGTVNVTIGTVAVANAGQTSGQDWDQISFVSSAGLTNVAPVGEINLGFNGGGATSNQTVTFSTAVTNPFILINYTENGEVFNFGANQATPISLSGATFSGNSVTTNAGAVNDANSGFIVAFYGSFTSLNFTITDSGAADSVAFSVAVPEPSTYALCSIAGGMIAFMARRKRKIN